MRWQHLFTRADVDRMSVEDAHFVTVYLERQRRVIDQLELEGQQDAATFMALSLTIQVAKIRERLL